MSGGYDGTTLQSFELAQFLLNDSTRLENVREALGSHRQLRGWIIDAFSNPYTRTILIQDGGFDREGADELIEAVRTGKIDYEYVRHQLTP